MEKNDIKKDNIVILGDSTMKHVDNWQFSRLLKSKNKRVKVIHFSGATTAVSKVTSNQHSNETQNKVILHIGNNDWRSTLEPIGIASNIIDLAKKKWRKNGCNAIISEILPRGDKLIEKAKEVNTALHELCESENQRIIKHQNFSNLDNTWTEVSFIQIAKVQIW